MPPAYPDATLQELGGAAPGCADEDLRALIRARRPRPTAWTAKAMKGSAKNAIAGGKIPGAMTATPTERTASIRFQVTSAATFAELIRTSTYKGRHSEPKEYFNTRQRQSIASADYSGIPRKPPA